MYHGVHVLIFAQRHPKLSRWRNTPFPLYNAVENAVGEILSPGTYSSYLGQRGQQEPEEDNFPASVSSTPDGDGEPSETQANKRHRESAALERSANKKTKSFPDFDVSPPEPVYGSRRK